MKKIISIILVMMCILTSITTINADEVNASEKTLSFSDVKSTHWFYNNVTEMIELGIVNGYEDGTFRPQVEIKADEFIKMVLVAMGYEPCQSDSTYWADGYITKAEELKIVDKTFINDYRYNLTREQASRIIVNALSLKETKPIDTYNEYIKTAINDYHLIADKHKQDVIDCYAWGIMQGDTNKNINPKQTITRAEATTVILRMINADRRIKTSFDDVKSITLINNERNKYIEVVAPSFRGKPLNEIIEVAEAFYNASLLTKGIDEMVINPYTNRLAVKGYENQRKSDFVSAVGEKDIGDISNEQMDLVAKYGDYSFIIDTINLSGKYTPYNFVAWNNFGILDDEKYLDEPSKWGEYFKEYYLGSIEAFFKVLFEDEYKTALKYITDALSYRGKETVYKGVVINERFFDIKYSRSALSFTISLKNEYK